MQADDGALHAHRVNEGGVERVERTGEKVLVEGSSCPRGAREAGNRRRLTRLIRRAAEESSRLRASGGSRPSRSWASLYRVTVTGRRRSTRRGLLIGEGSRLERTARHTAAGETSSARSAALSPCRMLL